MRLRSRMKLRSSAGPGNYLHGNNFLRKRPFKQRNTFLTLPSRRRGKRRVKRGTRSTPQPSTVNKGLLDSFVPVKLVRSLCDMTCTVQGIDAAQSSSCTYFRCADCPAGFCSEEEFAHHTRTQHPAPPPPDAGKRAVRTCRACGYTAPDPGKADTHQKLHRDEKRGKAVFRCKACNFLSCSKMGVTIHKRLEHAPLKYQCPMCNYASFNARHVTAHVDRVHCNPVEEPWECPYCSAELESGLSLKTHLQSEHQDESQFKEYTCDMCDYTCHTNTDIVHHLKAHRAKKKLYKCTKCPFISTKFDRYAQHLDLVHDEAGAREEELTHELPVVEDKSSIPVIRVIQKREECHAAAREECRTAAPEEVDINNIMYTPPTSPVVRSDSSVKSDPRNIFDRMSLKNQDKVKVCHAVGLRASPRKRLNNGDTTKPPRIHKLRMAGGGVSRKSLKRCRYCTTKTMFDSLKKLRQHHIKAHGISDLGVQLGMRQYKCKYCPDRPEFEGLQALKDHYAAFHNDSSLRKLVKRSRSQQESNESAGAESEPPKPSLLEEAAEPSCETKRQDMLDCILQSQKQIGKALKDSSPECNLTDTVSRSRLGRINSAPTVGLDYPPSVKPLLMGPEEPVKSRASAPATPLAPPSTALGTSPTNKTIPDYQANLGTSIYNLSLAELQILQQRYSLYQAYCMKMYYTDPIYRQYVHEKQAQQLLEQAGKSPALQQQPLVKISDPRTLAQSALSSSTCSLAQPTPSPTTVGLQLTKPKLGPTPGCSPEKPAFHQCFVATCDFSTTRLLELKHHISVAHNVRITDKMEAELEKLIRMQEGVKPAAERSPNVTISNHNYPCSLCAHVLDSFDAYVQHMIEAHRSELGISQTSTLDNYYHPTSPTKPPTIKQDVQSPTSSQDTQSECYHVVGSAEALQRHAHVAAHRCSVCEYLAPSEGSLSVHMNVHKT